MSGGRTIDTIPSMSHESICLFSSGYIHSASELETKKQPTFESLYETNFKFYIGFNIQKLASKRFSHQSVSPLKIRYKNSKKGNISDGQSNQFFIKSYIKVESSSRGGNLPITQFTLRSFYILIS